MTDTGCSKQRHYRLFNTEEKFFLIYVFTQGCSWQDIHAAFKAHFPSFPRTLDSLQSENDRLNRACPVITRERQLVFRDGKSKDGEFNEYNNLTSPRRSREARNIQLELRYAEQIVAENFSWLPGEIMTKARELADLRRPFRLEWESVHGKVATAKRQAGGRAPSDKRRHERMKRARREVRLDIRPQPTQPSGADYEHLIRTSYDNTEASNSSDGKGLQAALESCIRDLFPRLRAKDAWLVERIARAVVDERRPFMCIWQCDRTSFRRKINWHNHVNRFHHRVQWWECEIDGCHQTSFRRDLFVHHLISTHKVRDNDLIKDGVEKYRKERGRKSYRELCFCGEILGWKELPAHITQHMSRIRSQLPLLKAREAEAESGRLEGHDDVASVSTGVPRADPMRIGYIVDQMRIDFVVG